MREPAIVIPARLLRLGLAVLGVLAVVAVVLLPASRQMLATGFAPRAVADAPAVEAQRRATERAIQRGYAKAIGQLRQVRELTLAIPPAEAEAIDVRAREDLRVIRRDALSAVGQLLGLNGRALESYVAAAESSLDSSARADEPDLLLAPDLFAIVRRADELFQQRADAATRELTRAPSAPSPTPSPTSSPTPRR